MSRTAWLLALLLPWAPSAAAQQSAGFKLEEHTIHCGGHPAGGATLASASFRVTLDAIGDEVAGSEMSSASFSVASGFPAGFPPPGEVRDLRFADAATLQWSPERSVGSYVLYSGTVDGLPLDDYGVCLSEDIAIESAVAWGGPPSGEVGFYLVTAVNRLGEEGTTGFRSDEVERPAGTPCP